ncbi:hypothetical protein G5I_08970 [Acromyrmex echinatior]|uniref:Uncharacterized protein n=1 Tax=Acromyrmex echinatior TaxID=103372 RepID=F4WSZ8_ACREC|nr:hypothetical protein G5I_08970 [Acromyrmex echinatior]
MQRTDWDIYGFSVEDIKSFQVVVTEAYNLIQLKNQPDISDSSDLTETNRLSITRQENRALDECRGELGVSTVMRKTGYADNHRAMRRRKNRVRGMRRGKKRGFHLAIDTRRYHPTFSLTLGLTIGRVPFLRKIEHHDRNARSRKRIVSDCRKGWRYRKGNSAQWKIVIGRFDDATQCTRNYDGAHSFVLMKAVEWKLRLRSTSILQRIGIFLLFDNVTHYVTGSFEASQGYCLQHPKADDNGSTLHSRSTMGPITGHSHFAEAFLPVKYVRNVRCKSKFWLEPLTVPFKATRTTPFTMLESNVSNGKMPYVDATPNVNSPGAKSLEAVERELTVRRMRTASRTPEFSPLRECNELAIPSDWLHLRGSRMVTSAFVIASTRTRISRKRLFEFPPTVHVTPERSSINNTPYAMSPHSLRSDTRYREVVTVYYTSFNWHPGFVNFQPSCVRSRFIGDIVHYIDDGFRMQGVYAADKAPRMFRDWSP